MTVAERIPMVLPHQFGRDHFSTLAYVECRIADHRGLIQNDHMRTNPRAHRKLLGDSQIAMRMTEWNDAAYATRLADGTRVPQHDDWSCLEDMQAAGWLTAEGMDIDPAEIFGGGRILVSLTPTGQAVASALREFKEKGGSTDGFAKHRASNPPPTEETDGE